MPRCQSCGILIPVEEIVKEHEGHEVTVCGDKCFRIYRTYWYPRYGQQVESQTDETG